MRSNFIQPVIENLYRTADAFALSECTVAKHFLLHLMGLALTLTVVFTVPHTTHAQENNTPTAVQILAESIDNSLANHRSEISDLEERIEQIEGPKSTIENRIKTSIFTAANHYRGISKALPAAVALLVKRVNVFFTPSTWQTQWLQIKTGGFSPWVIFGFWLASILWLQARFRVILQRVEKGCEASTRFHRGLGIRLLRRSLLLLGMTLLFGVYSSLDQPLLEKGLELALYNTFLILLGARWGLDYLDHGFSSPKTALRSYVALQLNRLIRILRACLIAGSWLMWAAGFGSLLIRLSIDILAVGLLVWTVVFWRRMTPVAAGAVRKGETGFDQLRTSLAKGWSYLVSGGMLFLSVAGYNLLAWKWTSAWIKTLVLLFLGRIILNAHHEWLRKLRVRAVATDEDHQLDSAHQLRRSLILLFEGVLYLCLAKGLIAAWDYHDLVISRLNQLFDANFVIGSLNFSLKGILTAAVILFLTHLLVRIGCSLLRDRVLDRKHLERGFQDSVLTVSRYLGWGIGLMLALGTIGVNTTSLAVVFGALSVGIGFGLQTIFNNFISGLILLFERPIQVGDTIEINGMWAEVKKINVRATVVQTFDNASVIIPNSEFISRQVTNWSFKDTRMRRNIEVGVAYGSDIDLVEKTLLEIAQNNQNVLNYPQPQVLFTDHGASALIFRLRIWVDLANLLVGAAQRSTRNRPAVSRAEYRNRLSPTGCASAHDTQRDRGS